MMISYKFSQKQFNCVKINNSNILWETPFHTLFWLFNLKYLFINELFISLFNVLSFSSRNNSHYFQNYSVMLHWELHIFEIYILLIWEKYQINLLNLKWNLYSDFKVLNLEIELKRITKWKRRFLNSLLKCWNQRYSQNIFKFILKIYNELFVNFEKNRIFTFRFL
jgi:hypothetical protein